MPKALIINVNRPRQAGVFETHALCVILAINTNGLTMPTDKRKLKKNTPSAKQEQSPIEYAQAYQTVRELLAQRPVTPIMDVTGRGDYVAMSNKVKRAFMEAFIALQQHPETDLISFAARYPKEFHKMVATLLPVDIKTESDVRLQVVMSVPDSPSLPTQRDMVIEHTPAEKPADLMDAFGCELI